MSSTTIEVAKYIHDLLYEYSSVIVPNLGAFSTRNKMAAINDDDQTISPPIKTVVFNEKLKVNDGILVGHIAKMESIPPSLVEEALKKFAAQTKTTLQAGEAVSLGSLGTLQDEGDKGIQFYPTQDLNLSLNSFGFKTLDLPVIAATTPPNSNENIGGAAGVGGTSELDLSSFEEEKNLPEEEEIPDTPSEKRTVSSVLAENAQNLPPAIPPEKRRKSGGGWFWLLPLLILGLCIMLIMQLQKEDNRGMTSHETNTEESSGLWNIPPFSWFSGDNDKNRELVDNLDTDRSGNTDSSTDNHENGNNNGGTQTNNNGAVETVDTGDKTGQDSNASNNENTANNDNTNNTSSNETGNDTRNNDTANETTTNTNNNTEAANSESSNTETKTSTTDNSTANTNNSGSTTLTNTSALNGINIAKARAGEYSTSNAPKGYYIIVGAFKSQANADKAISKLKKKGYEAHALKTTSGYYRVGIYGSTNGNTAKERYNKARANENKKAWLLNFN